MFVDWRESYRMPRMIWSERAQWQGKRKPAGRAEEKVDQSENDAIIEWARRNTTLVFPIVLKALQPIVLQDRGQQVKIPIQVGGAIRASRFHPTAPGFLVVSQPNSDKFLATTPISSTSFVEMVRPKYDGQSNKMGSGGNPLVCRSEKTGCIRRRTNFGNYSCGSVNPIYRGCLRLLDSPSPMGWHQ